MLLDLYLDLCTVVTGVEAEKPVPEPQEARQQLRWVECGSKWLTHIDPPCHHVMKRNIIFLVCHRGIINIYIYIWGASSRSTHWINMDKHSSDSFVWSGSLHWLHWILHCSFHLCDTVNPSAPLCQEPQETVRVFEHAVTGRVWHVFPLQYSKRSKPSGVSLDLTMLPRWDDYRKLRKHYINYIYNII